jgi:hypothetical protein
LLWLELYASPWFPDGGHFYVGMQPDLPPAISFAVMFYACNLGGFPLNSATLYSG